MSNSSKTALAYGQVSGQIPDEIYRQASDQVRSPMSESISGRVFRVQRYSIHDGPGIRTTLFFQGCPLGCQWCHNPESQAEGSSATQVMDVETAMEKIERDTIFFDSSEGGVTFSGGEPLAQPRFLTALLKECRAGDIHTAVDTSGFAPVKVMEEVAGLCDLLLFDLKIIDGIEHQNRTGVSVKPILENLTLIADMDVKVRLRLPLVPGITAIDNNVDQIIGFLADKVRLRTIDLLPFHRTADAKYQRLGITNPMENIAEPDQEHVQLIKEKFMNNGFIVSLGG